MLNKAILVGRLTADPELKTASSGTEFCNFTIAINRQGKEEKTDFLDCVAFRNQAVNLANFMRKGSLIGVEGKLQIDNYQTETGENRRSFRIVVDQITFLESKKERSQKSFAQASPSNDFDRFQETDIEDLEDDLDDDSDLDKPY